MNPTPETNRSDQADTQETVLNSTRDPYTRLIAVLLFGLALLVSILLLSADDAAMMLIETRCVTYRFASVLNESGVMRYNVDQPATTAPAPLDVLIIAAGMHAGWSPDHVDRAVLSLSLAACTALIFMLLAERGTVVQAIGGALLYVMGALVWGGYNMPVHLSAALILAAMMLARDPSRARAAISGLLVSLASLIAIEAIVAIGLVFLLLPRHRRWFAGVCFSALLSVGLAVVTGALPSRPFVSYVEIPIDVARIPYLVVAGAALIGWLSARQLPSVSAVTAWGALSVVAAWVLSGQWVTLPAWIALSMLAAHGAIVVAHQAERQAGQYIPPSPALWRGLFRGVIAGSLLTALILWVATQRSVAANESAGNRVASLQAVIDRAVSTTPTDAVVAVEGDLCLLRVPRRVLDLTGRLDFRPSQAAAHGDFESPVLAELPYAILTTLEDPPYAESASFTALYTVNESSDSDTRLYTLSSIGSDLPRDEWVTYPADLDAAGRVRLVGYAIDSETVKIGRPVRIRLDWETQPANAPFNIDVTLLTPPAEIFATGGLTFRPSVWTEGRFSTVHLLQWSRVDVEAQSLTLAVSVNYPDERPLLIVGQVAVTPD